MENQQDRRPYQAHEVKEQCLTRGYGMEREDMLLCPPRVRAIQERGNPENIDPLQLHQLSQLK
jgi:hypothetical protein